MTTSILKTLQHDRQLSSVFQRLQDLVADTTQILRRYYAERKRSQSESDAILAMARTWRAARPGMRPPTRRSIRRAQEEPREASPSQLHHCKDKRSGDYREDQDNTGDDDHSEGYHEGLASRWGVVPKEFDYDKRRPRIWLDDGGQGQNDYDRWSLSPWALAYYDRYPEEIDKEPRAREYYDRSAELPRVQRFIDKQRITQGIEWDGGHFDSDSFGSRVPEENLNSVPEKDSNLTMPAPETDGNTAAMTYWPTGKKKERSNWLVLGGLVPAPTVSRNNRLPNPAPLQHPIPPSTQQNSLQGQDRVERRKIRRLNKAKSRHHRSLDRAPQTPRPDEKETSEEDPSNGKEASAEEVESNDSMECRHPGSTDGMKISAEEQESKDSMEYRAPESSDSMEEEP